MNIRHLSARALAVPALAGVLLTASAAVASAHVTISPSTGQAGAYTVLTVSVPHGCDGSATTKIAIKLPDDITTVTPTRNPYWTVAVTKQKLAQPVTDAHGNTLTERDATVTYTATTPLPDKQRDTFELSLKLPAGNHQITLQNPQFNIKTSFSVTVRSGETLTVVKNLQESPED